MPTHTLIRAEGLSEPISHYSDAGRAGNTTHVSGQGSIDEHGRLVGRGDVVAQTRKVLDNAIEGVLIEIEAVAVVNR